MKQTKICILSFLIVTLLVAYRTNATEQEDREFLEAHNKARLEAGLPLFTYDKKLAEYALKFALSRARDCSLRHSDGPYGENLFWGNAAKSLKWTPKDAVNAWYKLSEVKKFSDDTLVKIQENLIDMLSKNKLGNGNKRLKGRDWTDYDVKSSREMLKKIDETLRA
ncbi:cysteine-rich secretory protein, allergen V5/Tpx-1-related protein [Tanacetum coccineum]